MRASTVCGPERADTARTPRSPSRERTSSGIRSRLPTATTTIRPAGRRRLLELFATVHRAIADHPRPSFRLSNPPANPTFAVLNNVGTDVRSNASGSSDTTCGRGSSDVNTRSSQLIHAPTVFVNNARLRPSTLAYVMLSPLELPIASGGTPKNMHTSATFAEIVSKNWDSSAVTGIVSSFHAAPVTKGSRFFTPPGTGPSPAGHALRHVRLIRELQMADRLALSVEIVPPELRRRQPQTDLRRSVAITDLPTGRPGDTRNDGATHNWPPSCHRRSGMTPPSTPTTRHERTTSTNPGAED